MKITNNYSVTSELELPYLETQFAHLKEILETLVQKFGLKKDSKQILADLGSGDGRIIIYAGLDLNIKTVGFEINQSLIQKSRQILKSLKKTKKYKKSWFRNIKVKREDLFVQDLGKFDFIYIFTLPTMQKYLKHLIITIKKNAIIISYKYPLLSFESDLKLELELTHEYLTKTSTFFYRKI